MQDVRWEPREPKNGTYCLTWQARDGMTHSAEGRGLDISKSGVGLECSRELAPGSVVFVEARDASVEGDCVVVHCERSGINYRIGLEFRDDAAPHPGVPGGAPAEIQDDYYEILQISPKADILTIHRVFRIMAARFHPDNPETGSLEEFLRLKEAYTVLSDADRRAEYDARRQSQEERPMPIFQLKDFVTGVEAESNRRLGVLALLYNQRRSAPDTPGVSLLDLEQRMGFPREYLAFTLWFLRAKDYVTVADNSDYTVTAPGAEYVEKKAVRNEIVGRLLKPGSSRAQERPRTAGPSTKRNGSEKTVPSKGRFLLGTTTAPRVD